MNFFSNIRVGLEVSEIEFGVISQMFRPFKIPFKIFPSFNMSSNDFSLKTFSVLSSSSLGHRVDDNFKPLPFLSPEIFKVNFR